MKNVTQERVIFHEQQKQERISTKNNEALFKKQSQREKEDFR